VLFVVGACVVAFVPSFYRLVNDRGSEHARKAIEDSLTKSIEQEKDPTKKVELIEKLKISEIKIRQQTVISFLGWIIIGFQFVITLVLFGIFFIIDIALLSEFWKLSHKGTILETFNTYYTSGSAKALLLLILVQTFIFSRKFGVSTMMQKFSDLLKNMQKTVRFGGMLQNKY
jgi:hypothetical protein